MDCKKCEFFEEFSKTDNKRGKCRRFPPTQDGGNQFSIDHFPTVAADYWCGEYKERSKK